MVLDDRLEKLRLLFENDSRVLAVQRIIAKQRSTDQEAM